MIEPGGSYIQSSMVVKGPLHKQADLMLELSVLTG